MSTIVTSGASPAGNAMTTVGLVLAAALVITACSIGIYMKRKCTQSSLQPTTVRNLQTTLWVGIGLGGLLLLGTLLFAMFSKKGE